MRLICNTKSSFYTITIRLVLLYLVGTVIFYFVGPINWNTPSPVKLIAFLFAAFLMLYLGYICSINKCKIGNKDIVYENIIPEEILLNHLKFMLVLNLIVLVLYYLRNNGLSLPSFSDIITWLLNPSDQYGSAFDISVSGIWKYVGIVATVSSFFLWGTIPLGMVMFKKLPFGYKVLLLINVFFELLRWLAAGTNKGIIDFVLIVLCLVIYKLSGKEIKINSKIKYFLLSGVFVFLGLSYFSKNIGGRVGQTINKTIGNSYNLINFDNFLLKIFSPISNLIRYMDSYLTQGYYGLSLGLEQPFVPMFGVGHSIFLIDNIEQIFGVDLYQYTYAYRIDSNLWQPGYRWHSAFLWIANDVGPVGTILFMFVLGYYLGFISFHLLCKNDIYYFPLFCIMMQMMFYLPMNNQIFMTPFSFMGFWGMTIFMYLYRKKRLPHYKITI